MIKTEIARKLVVNALKKIADFPGEVDDFSTQMLHDAHIKVFLTSLDRYVREEPVVDGNGNEHPGLQYSVPLSMTLFKTWKTFGDCIKHVVDKHDIAQR